MNVRGLRRLAFLFSLGTAMPVQSWTLDSPDRVTLKVDGMHCQSCVSMIKKTVKKVPGVETVSIDLESGLVQVEGDSAAFREKTIAEAIERMGYDVVSPDSANIMRADSTQHQGH